MEKLVPVVIVISFLLLIAKSIYELKRGEIEAKKPQPFIEFEELDKKMIEVNLWYTFIT